MRIRKINKIKAHRIFQEFSWPAELLEFGRFNLLYGWNGCGKTTLSNLFRSMERKQDVTEGECDFQIDEHARPGNSFSSGIGLPRVRVFNRDFVAANFSSVASEMSLNPIYFIGENSVEKQKQIEELKSKLESETTKAAAKERQQSAANDALNALHVREAKAIKDLLSSSPPNTYNNYDKRYFRTAVSAQEKPEAASKILSEEEKTKLKQRKDEKPKEKVSVPSINLPNGLVTKDGAAALLKRTVVSQVLDELAGDADVAEWVKHGIELHKGEHKTETCRFCGGGLKKDRLEKLEAHFNDEYNQLIGEIDAAIRNIETAQNTLKEIKIPDKAQLHDHLSSDFEAARNEFEQFTKPLDQYLEHIKAALMLKRAKPFESLSLDSYLSEVPIPNDNEGIKALARIKECITQHNTESDDFQSRIEQARQSLEECMVAEALPEIERKDKAIAEATEQFQKLSRNVQTLTAEIAALEKQIVSHRQPAEELNEELRNYLGRDELQFEFKGSGYQITRNGLAASNLSEGERTAIAFLYFLKSLQGNDFALKDDIVIIDDPVSSLDANSLFCAFGYMKSRTKEAGQLFILTHNFTFFRQARNWFHRGLRGQDKKQGRFYFIEAQTHNGRRNASIAQLDNLLREYESEYHYLFKRVYEEAQKAGGRQPLEEYYHLPNLGRRLLESFFGFRFPQERGDLYKQLERSKCEPATASRLLRFLDTYSHSQAVGETGQDLSILAETPQILKDLMDLIKAEDPSHYGEMEKLVTAKVA